MSYKIVGDSKVADKNPGDTLTDEDLEGANVEALINGGHIRPVTPKTETPSKKKG